MTFGDATARDIERLVRLVGRSELFVSHEVTRKSIFAIGVRVADAVHADGSPATPPSDDVIAIAASAFEAFCDKPKVAMRLLIATGAMLEPGKGPVRGEREDGLLVHIFIAELLQLAKNIRNSRRP